MSYMSDFEQLNGRYVAFGGNPKGGKIYGKGKIRTRKLDFDDVYFVKELRFNLFSVSQMCDKKNSVLFTDTECLILSPAFKLPDENQVVLRVPRENNMYNVDLKNIVPFGALTCLFAKATLDESNFWHRRLGHINFKTMNKLVKGNLVRGLPSKVFENDHTCVACKKGKQHRAYFLWDEGEKMEFSVPRTPQQNGIAERKNKALIENRVLVTKPQNKTPYEHLLGRTPSIGFMRPFGYLVTILNTLDPLEKAGEESVQQYVLFSVWSSGFTNPQNTDDAAFGGKSHVESSTRYRNLSAEFEDFFDNNINEVNAVDSLVPAVGKIFTNSTNTFCAAGPSNAAVSPTHGKSSYVDTSQYTDDPNMPELKDITYSDDEEDVGAEADFTNLETSITVSPIPTIGVHKDHHINNDDFHTCMFSCFPSQEEPKRVHQALKDPSWIEAMQEELLQLKMQKVWVLVDLPHGKRAI
nr:ribonuclease H-like domain-containing protein [Tanacetum cinerariifolium]